MRIGLKVKVKVRNKNYLRIELGFDNFILGYV